MISKTSRDECGFLNGFAPHGREPLALNRRRVRATSARLLRDTGEMMKIAVLATLMVALGGPVSAQNAGTWVPGVSRWQVLRAGTPVTLRTMNELTTNGKHLKVGDRFALEVAEAVALDGQVVVPAGSNAVGEVTSIRNKGMWGKSGNIETRLLYVIANSRKIRLRGSVGDKGQKAGGGAIATSAIVFLPAGFFMTGTSAVVRSGTMVAGLVDEDVPVAFVAPPVVAPMVVGSGAVPAAVVSAPPSADGTAAAFSSAASAKPVGPATPASVPVAMRR